MNAGRLKGCKVALRPVEPDDAAAIVRWRNSPGVREWLFSDEELTPAGHEAWYRSYLEDASQVRFVIEAEGTGPVGVCGLTDRNDTARTAHLTILIGEEAARGRGLAGEALKLLLDFAVRDWGLLKVRAELFADNLPARCLYKRAGFRDTGAGIPRRGREVSVMEFRAPGDAR